MILRVSIPFQKFLSQKIPLTNEQCLSPHEESYDYLPHPPTTPSQPSATVGHYVLLHHHRLGINGPGRVIATVTLPTAVTSSLVPRPLPPPVSVHLRYANTEGEGLGDLVNTGNVSIRRQRVDTRGVGPSHNNSHFVSTRPRHHEH